MAARVRLAQHDDLAALAAIENDADQLLIDWLRPAHWGSAASGESRASGPGFILVAELDDVRLAGFVHVLEVNGPFYGTAGFVEEEPSTPFHRSLIVIEEELGLDRYGRRIQMTAQLD